MVVMRVMSDNRSSSCLKKYRIFFVFGVFTLCAQVYLAYVFLALDNGDRDLARQRTDEIFSKLEEDEGLPVGTRQLKLPPDKQTNAAKSLQSAHNRTRVKLDRRNLSFTPMCEVTSREAVSAVTRAQTQYCKQRIVNVTCLSQQGLLYPVKLKSSCPHSQGFKESPKNLGCFKDDKTMRTLSGYYTVLKSTNSPVRCAQICLQSGFPYSGVEYSVECFCGIREPPQLQRLPDSSCNMKCPGDSKQSCGGYLTINVFSTGIQRFKPQEARNCSSSNSNERQARVAYLLTVNGRASRQVKRLIRILYHPAHLFYIHVDARQDYLYREMLEVENKCKYKNIHVAKGENRRASIWGGASLLSTFLSSARQLLSYDNDWDFLINLSESDYPVKSNELLVEFLTANKGMNFVKSHGREVQRFISKQGLDKTFVECEARMWRVGDRKLPYGIQVDGGSDWVALSRDFVEYVSDPEPDPMVSELLKIFEYTLLPAESFFHTILRNSRFCDTYVDNNLHVTNWKRKLGCKCQYKAVVDWCGCSPNDFKVDDFGRIRNMAERNLFFARKFEPVIDQRIIDRIETWLYPDSKNRTAIAKGYDAYWQSLYHHADLSPPNDDVLMTIIDSIARLSFQSLGPPDVGVNVIDSHAYFRENKFRGFLVRSTGKAHIFESSTEQNEFPEEMEIFAKVSGHLSATKVWMDNIVVLQVNTEYDQKEQTFRNFVGGIGPLSSLVLAYEFDGALSLPINLTVLWVDPYGHLADVNQLQLDDGSLIGHIRPQVNEKLVIGNWNLLLVANDEPVIRLNFLVSPLSYWKNKKITSEKAREIHNGSSGPYHQVKDVNEKWRKLLDSLGINMTARSGLFEGDEVGIFLERWVDSLVSEHYKIVKMCQASDIVKSKSTLERCSSTTWSSLSPDSKSDTRNVCQKFTR